jgi:hypothetical protein
MLGRRSGSAQALAELSQATLKGYEGKNIKEICDTGAWIGDEHNHCAHFVAHVLGIRAGLLCGDMKFASRGQGASMRVNEIYNSCEVRGTWDSRPASTSHCLVFATLPSNMTGTDMGSHSKKHIGIFVSDTIWHYSNGSDHVVTDSPTSFLNKFKGVYGKTTTLYYGVP